MAGLTIDAAVMRELISLGTGWNEAELRFALHAAVTAVSIEEDTNFLEAPIGVARRMDPALWQVLRSVLEQLITSSRGSTA
jgi:hypothetical protein